MSNSFGKVCIYCRGTGLQLNKEKLTFCEACEAKGKDGDGMLFQWPKGYDEDYKRECDDFNKQQLIDQGKW